MKLPDKECVKAESYTLSEDMTKMTPRALISMIRDIQEGLREKPTKWVEPDGYDDRAEDQYGDPVVPYPNKYDKYTEITKPTHPYPTYPKYDEPVKPSWPTSIPIPLPPWPKDVELPVEAQPFIPEDYREEQEWPVPTVKPKKRRKKKAKKVAKKLDDPEPLRRLE